MLTTEPIKADSLVYKAAMSQTFTLSGLQSRGGLSNWIFFFRDTELVRVDVGMMPALKAGALAGIGAEGGAYGPQLPQNGDVEAWLAQLGARAKQLIRQPLDEIRSVRLLMRMGANHLFLRTAEGRQRFVLMNRHESEPVAALLAERLGDRFLLDESGPFRFFKRYAPFLTR